MGEVNKNLNDVEYKKKLLKEGINRINKYMNNLKEENNEKMSLLSEKIEVEGNILRVSNDMKNLKWKIDLLIESVVNEMKGVLKNKII